MTCNLNRINTISAPDISYRGSKDRDKKMVVGNIEGNIATKTDEFIEKIDNERKKKKNRIAIAAATGGISLSLLVLLLNPKYSGKIIQKMKSKQLSLSQKVERDKNNFLKSKFYKFGEKVFGGGVRGLEFVCNGNSVKDIAYTKICTRKVDIKADDKFLQKLGKKIRNLHVSVMKKPHEFITECADKLAKRTVKGSYSKSLNKMDKLETLINTYKSKLTSTEQKAVEAELAKLTGFKGYCSEGQVLKRLESQIKCMTNLEEDTMKGCKKFFSDLGKDNPNRRADFDNNFKFWAQELMQPEKEKLEKAGMEEVNKAIGENGVYTNIINILKKSEGLNQTEKDSLDKPLKKLTTALQNANKNETEKYFFKKKDLVLGSAPTDILTATIMGSVCGIYVAKADTKEERISKTITKAVPVITGLATNIMLTAALWSGGKSLAVAGAIGFVVGRIGSYIDQKLFGHDNDVIEETNKDKKMEAVNV